MLIAAESLDDLLGAVFKKVLKKGERLSPSRGATREMIGVMLQLNKPRARLSRTDKKSTVFSCLGELLWYLANTDSLAFMTYYIDEYGKYSDDGVTVHGAYGPRLFGRDTGINQIENIISLLKKKPHSRRAAVQIFEARDNTTEYKDIPCTCTLHFTIRNDKLNLLTFMRSNDAFLGLPHDVFAFTMLQELVARSLGVRLGVYRHAVGSLHVYEKNVKDVKTYLKEGWQSRVAMPHMPEGDPWPAVKTLLYAEREIRDGQEPTSDRISGLDPYWMDLVRLLQIFRRFKEKDQAGMNQIASQMVSHTYAASIAKKSKASPKPSKAPPPPQLSLDFARR
ncbi:MAG: thymidylate synthase [Myxococcales bacterium]|nr:thymidylate synthase [Myxococcales bacterium]